MITDNEHKDTYTIYSQTSIIHMYCTMESTYLVLQGRRQLVGWVAIEAKSILQHNF